MIDQGKFVNAYIDVALNTLTDYLKANLQLQAQLKINSEVVGEKDNIISSLNQQLLENKEAEDWKQKYEALEKNYHAASNKVSHMNTLLNQLNDMKRIVEEKNIEILHLNNKINEIQTPIAVPKKQSIKAKVINKNTENITEKNDF